MKPKKFSSEHIGNEVLFLTSETSYSEDCLDTKIQYRFYKSDQNVKQLEEELIYFTKQQNQEL